MISDVSFFLLAGLAVTCLGLSKSGFAGFGLAAAPLLSLAVPPVQAAAILLPIMLLQDAISVWVYRRDWDNWNLTVLLPGAALGIGVAWLLAAYTSDALLRLSVGLAGLAFALNHWTRRTPNLLVGKPSPISGVLWGSIAGFAGTLAHAAGPPFQIFVLPQKLDKLALVGTTAIFFAALNTLKVVPYFALGFFSAGDLVTSLTLVPLAVATNFLGFWLVRRTPSDLFYRIAYALIFLVSAALTAQGAAGVWRG